ncbi:hypothetical protein E4U35_002977 [Claviceps purpurea]|nr:hypothetical protein E4U35_002977 [Claviceps purpurea]
MMHSTTISEGERKPDPKGWHVTFSFKTQEQLDSGTHVTCHAYVDIRGNFAEATHSDEMADSFEYDNGKTAWPPEALLDEVPTKFVLENMQTDNSTVVTQSEQGPVVVIEAICHLIRVSNLSEVPPDINIGVASDMCLAI